MSTLRRRRWQKELRKKVLKSHPHRRDPETSEHLRRDSHAFQLRNIPENKIIHPLMSIGIICPTNTLDWLTTINKSWWGCMWVPRRRQGTVTERVVCYKPVTSQSCRLGWRLINSHTKLPNPHSSDSCSLVRKTQTFGQGFLFIYLFMCLLCIQSDFLRPETRGYKAKKTPHLRHLKQHTPKNKKTSWTYIPVFVSSKVVFLTSSDVWWRVNQGSDRDLLPGFLVLCLSLATIS